MNKKKLKIVWLCHFTNKNVQFKIKPSKRTKEKAPWISSTLKLFENDDSVELFVISPHEYITGINYYKSSGINFYFYNAHMPFIGRHWPEIFKWDYLSNFKKNKRIVKKLIKKIQPDIIHLHGAENAYYSSTILQFVELFPTILTVQGFISKASDKSLFQIKKRIIIEKEIFKNTKHAFYRTQTMGNDIKELNPLINLYWNDYPNKIIKPINNTPKIYDVVFFARISKDKGIEDLLRAIKIIKKKRENISLCIIGEGKIEPFKNLAKELNVSENITWAGFLQTQEDVHRLASSAKISVLPTYHDIISGTIIESLFLKIPVVAYNVGSIHEVNKHEEIISLVKKLDVEGLAKSILVLLNNEKLQQEKAEKGYKRAIEMFDHSNDEIKQELLNTYEKVITHFNNSISE